MPKSPAVFVRRSTLADVPTLARLAAASGLPAAPQGRYLVAEVDDEIVAAAPLDDGVGPVHDPSVGTADIRELLTRWAANVRRHAAPLPKAA